MPSDGSNARETSPARANELRALGHPLRMRAYLLLRVEGPMTIGALSKRLGAAVGSVSYHMEQLHRAHLVERAPSPDGDKRKSWWQARQGGARPAFPNLETPEARNDAELFRRAEGAVYQDLYQAYRDKADQLPVVWQEAEQAKDAVLTLTPAELAQLGDDIEKVLRTWDERSAQHTPGDGAERVAVLMQGFRWMV